VKNGDACVQEIAALESGRAALSEELAGSRAEMDSGRVCHVRFSALQSSDMVSSDCDVKYSHGKPGVCFVRSTLLLSAALLSVDDCIHHFQLLFPSLKSLSVFKFEIITPSSSFVSDDSDQSLSYSDVLDFDDSKHIGYPISHLLHVFVCTDMQVCLLCHYSMPLMAQPISTFLDLALSRLLCARFMVLSILDPLVPSLNHAVKISVGAMEVRIFPLSITKSNLLK
jgi:hypothetical protein